eukprot:SAG22_NODE_2481_length_2528_cov_2.864553_1_plen_43_part_10
MRTERRLNNDNADGSAGLGGPTVAEDPAQARAELAVTINDSMA